jgi:multidrug resistance efflux pump
MRSSRISRPWGLKEFKQQFLEGDNKALLIAWAFAVLLITLVSTLGSTNRLSFFGIADSYELSINFEYPVKIKRIHVISGQFVEKGTLLAELNQNEIDAHIRELETTIQKLQFEKNMRNEIKNLMDDTKEFSSKGGSLSLDIESTKKELEIAQAQKDHLLIFAEKSGIIGAVNFKSGQTVPPFTTLLSILSQKPDMIKAYIHENVYSQVELNQELMLASLADKRKKFTGRVISIGSRIIEMPERLTNSAVIKVWGREVMVQLNETNTFLMGEKVVVYPKSWIPDELLPMPKTSLNPPTASNLEPAP